MAEEKDTDKEVKPSDALGRLASRSRSSRTVALLALVLGFFVLAFLFGLIFRGVSGGIENAPELPRVGGR